MLQSPSLGRAIIEQDFNTLTIMIPIKRKWFGMIFMIAWLGGWAFGEIMVTRTLFFSDQPFGLAGNWFLLFWLIAWTLGGGAAIMSLFGQIAGKEIIKVTGNQLEIRNDIWGIGRSNIYEINHIMDLEAKEMQMGFNTTGFYSFNFFNRSNGQISFDYGMKTIRFAYHVSQAEAKHLVSKLKENANFSEVNFA